MTGVKHSFTSMYSFLLVPKNSLMLRVSEKLYSNVFDIGLITYRVSSPLALPVLVTKSRRRQKADGDFLSTSTRCWRAIK